MHALLLAALMTQATSGLDTTQSLRRKFPFRIDRSARLLTIKA